MVPSDFTYQKVLIWNLKKGTASTKAKNIEGKASQVRIG
jgi:hypothetical protein